MACSLILSRIDYCKAVLRGAPSYTIKKLQRVQNDAARVVIQAPRRQPVVENVTLAARLCKGRVKVAFMTFKVRNTSTPAYLCRLIYRQRGQPEIGHHDVVLITV